MWGFAVSTLLLAVGVTSLVLNSTILPVFISQTGPIGPIGGTASISSLLPIQNGGTNSAITFLKGNRIMYSNAGSWVEGTSIFDPIFQQVSLNDSSNQLQFKGPSLSTTTTLSFDLPFPPNQEILFPISQKDSNFIVSKSDKQTINGRFVFGNGSVLFPSTIGQILVPNAQSPSHTVTVPLTPPVLDSAFMMTDSEFEQLINGNKDASEGIVSINRFLDNPVFSDVTKVRTFLPDTSFDGKAFIETIDGVQNFQNNELDADSVTVTLTATGGAFTTNGGSLAVTDLLQVGSILKGTSLNASNSISVGSNATISGPLTTSSLLSARRNITCGAVTVSNTTTSTGTTQITAGNLTVGGSMNLTGNVTASNISGINTGDLTAGVFGSTPNSAGGSIGLSQVLILQPASASFGGFMSTTTQTIPGAKKTFPLNFTVTDPTNCSSSTTGALVLQNNGGASPAQAYCNGLFFDGDCVIDRNLFANADVAVQNEGVIFYNNLPGSIPTVLNAYDVFDADIGISFPGVVGVTPVRLYMVVVGTIVTFHLSTYLPGSSGDSGPASAIGGSGALQIPLQYLPPTKQNFIVRTFNDGTGTSGLLELSKNDIGFGGVRFAIWADQSKSAWPSGTSGWDAFSVSYNIDRVV